MIYLSIFVDLLDCTVMLWHFALSLCAPVALAFDSASLPAAVNAGEKFTVTVTVDPETQSYSNWQSYRVYLSDYESYYGVNYPFCKSLRLLKTATQGILMQL